MAMAMHWCSMNDWTKKNRWDRDGEKLILITDFEQIVEWKHENRCSIEELSALKLMNVRKRKNRSRPNSASEATSALLSSAIQAKSINNISVDLFFSRLGFSVFHSFFDAVKHFSLSYSIKSTQHSKTGGLHWADSSIHLLNGCNSLIYDLLLLLLLFLLLLWKRKVLRWVYFIRRGGKKGFLPPPSRNRQLQGAHTHNHYTAFLIINSTQSAQNRRAINFLLAFFLFLSSCSLPFVIWSQY